MSPTILAPPDNGHGGTWVAPTLAYVPMTMAITSTVPAPRSRDPIGFSGTRVIRTAPTTVNDARPTRYRIKAATPPSDGFRFVIRNSNRSRTAIVHASRARVIAVTLPFGGPSRSLTGHLIGRAAC